MKTFEIMSNRESINLFLSRKKEVMPCFSQDGTFFFSKEEIVNFIEDIKNARGWNYETDAANKGRNLSITFESLEVRVFDDEKDEENYYSLEEIKEF